MYLALGAVEVLLRAVQRRLQVVDVLHVLLVLLLVVVETGLLTVQGLCCLLLLALQHDQLLPTLRQQPVLRLNLVATLVHLISTNKYKFT